MRSVLFQLFVFVENELITLGFSKVAEARVDLETIGSRGRDETTLKEALAKQVEEIRRVAASQAQTRNLFNFYDERLEVCLFSESMISIRLSDSRRQALNSVILVTRRSLEAQKEDR